jgi:hypothetical protein
MSKDVKTVPDLWVEWMVGLHGNPPIATMEAEPDKYPVYKAWRSSGPGRKYFSPRWAIIAEITRRKTLPSNKNRSLGDLAKDLEKERLETRPIPLGLKALGDSIKHQRQAQNVATGVAAGVATGVAAAAAPTPTQTQ